MALTRRKIGLRFQLGKGTFGDSGADTVEIDGLRVQATIDTVGGETMATCAFRVHGLDLNVMNSLTLLGKRLPEGRQNSLQLSAGDDATGMAVAFVGHITECWADLSGQPDAILAGTAMAGFVDTLKPVPPVSYDGNVDVATIIRGIAAQMTRPGGDGSGAAIVGYDFENSGVAGAIQLRDAYYSGSLIDQLRAVARDANINCVLDGTTVAIWPKDGSRGGAMPVISPQTGMVGYPLYTENGIQVTTLYNPNIRFGGKVKVESALKPAVGNWSPFQVTHDLESEMPGGKWFTRIACNVFDSETSLDGA